MSRAADYELEVDGRAVRVTHPDRVLWPMTGTVKADIIAYYQHVAEALLPHLRGRPATLHRFPEGVDGPHFFQTRCPPHPPWVRTTTLTYERTGKSFDAVVIDDRPSLVWAANLAAIELHPFLSCADSFDQPTWVVIDLDPGPPAGLPEAAQTALRAREHLAAAGLEPFVKTSGGKGLHLYAVLPHGASYDDSKRIARTLANALAQQHPECVVASMTKSLRAGRVLVDWSQNDAGKSTVAPYSLRGRVVPTVSMPVTWDEVEAVAGTGAWEALLFTPARAIERIERVGDLFAAALPSVGST